MNKKVKTFDDFKAIFLESLLKKEGSEVFGNDIADALAECDSELIIKCMNFSAEIMDATTAAQIAIRNYPITITNEEMAIDFCKNEYRQNGMLIPRETIEKKYEEIGLPMPKISTQDKFDVQVISAEDLPPEIVDEIVHMLNEKLGVENPQEDSEKPADGVYH